MAKIRGDKYLELNKKAYYLLYKIIKSEEEYLNFIKFYAKVYKYSLANALLIYEKNPKATALATYDLWKKIGYQVRMGARGIAVLSEEKYKIEYIFDVSSTIQQKIKLWEYIEEKHNKLISSEEDVRIFFLKSRIDFWENKRYNIDERLKDFAFFTGYMAKCERLGLNFEISEEVKNTILKEIKEGLFTLKRNDFVQIELEKIFTIVQEDLKDIEKKIIHFEKENNNGRDKNNRWNSSLQRRRGMLVSESQNGRIESWEIWQNGNETYEGNKARGIHLGGNIGAISEDISKSGRDVLEDDRRIYGEEVERRTSSRELERIGTGSTQKDVAKGDRGSSVTRDSLSRPLQGDRPKQYNIEEKEQKNVPFFNKGNSKEERNIDIEIHHITALEKRLRDIIYNKLNILGKEVLDGEKKLKEIKYNFYDNIEFEKIGENDYALSGYIMSNDEMILHTKFAFKIKEERIEFISLLDKFQNIDYKVIKEEDIEKTRNYFNSLLDSIIEQKKEITDSGEEEKNTSSFFMQLGENYDLRNKQTPYPITTNKKIQANIDAIKTVKKLEREKRLAREEEKEILANYVGFGGLPQVFENLENIQSPFIKEKSIELKEILTEEEYNLAKGSTLNAHYTPQEIIESMYKAVSYFGLKGSLKILEPSCGTGNFIGNVPESLKNSKITGVELDSITGRIARLLYPNANIKINRFEKEFFQENNFDLVVGNVPFGEYSVYDKKYNKNNYLIHDYFINKSIELTKPNGIVAVITSKGTLDKKDNTFRKELAKKAELIGAIRLPNIAFKKLAGTEVVTDILFLQKLEKEREEDVEWVNTTEVEYGNRINNYFINNPEMILGKLEYKTNRYGRFDLTVNFESEDFKESLKEVIKKLPKNLIKEDIVYTFEEEDNSDEDYPIELEKDSYKSYRYYLYKDEVYYKTSHFEIEKIENVRSRERLIALIKLRDLSKELIDVQLNKYSDKSIFEEKLKEFNNYYDEFVTKYGYINNRTNLNIFKDDDDIHFLSSLEKESNGKYVKGDFFYKRTIAPIVEITEVDNAKDGLIASLNKTGEIDFEYINSLYKNKDIKEIIEELIKDDLIFLNPLKYKKEDITKGWEIKSVYLNGNVKEKLKIAESFADESPYFTRNIEKLKEVIPQDVDFSDIKIDMGSNLYKEEDIRKFSRKLLNLMYEPEIRYSEKTSEWRIYNKNIYGYLATEEYGTKRMGALYILEKILNNQEVIIKDEIEEDDKKRYITNKEETIKANEKKLLIEKEFEEFVHENKDIRDRVMLEYNERFNNSINANFNIELNLPNISKDIKLREHQKRAIARAIFSPNNLLLDHQVGAGKTFIMIVSAMENKRMKKANKPLIVVPNNITAQFKNEFFRLYPNANILYADEKSFETKNRKRFLSKIAQNDYDAIIMGQSQFDLLKISKERRMETLEREIDNILKEITELDRFEDRLTIKILERTKKTLEKNLEKLMDSKEESLLDFEQLGIDNLYVDEAHLYKNLYFITKLRNIAGINQTNSQKALNLKMKIEYIEEIGGKVVFATGTPISNTMAEMYTMQRYLMQEKLLEQGIYNFDSWQKIFASTETKLEISPTGSGFQLKKRFSNFKNIPELMNLYNSFADVVTTDMINLPIPEYTKEVIEARITQELFREMKSFGKRAESCKNGLDPKIDNMLKIVHEGRYAGLDIRHIDRDYPDYEDSKVNLVINKVYEVYKDTVKEKSTQVIFSDLSTPKENEFNIYDDIKEKLIEKGVKEEEIAFVHSAKTSKQREEMFGKVRSGEIRVIIGSTQKMGAGTNFQDKLVALYHLDTPWRPSDLEQREGRILRQGNENKKVKIFKCITKGSFDAYSWQILEQKQRFIAQAKVGAITGREVKDIDEISINYAEIKALATGNPKIKRKMEVDTEIEKLKVLESAHRKKRYNGERFLINEYPEKMRNLKNKFENVMKDLKYIETIDFIEEPFEIEINGNKYFNREKAGDYVIKFLHKVSEGNLIGNYKGFEIKKAFGLFDVNKILIKRNESYEIPLNQGYKGANISLIENFMLKNIKVRLDNLKKQIKELKEEKEQVEKTYELPFEHKEALEKLLKEKIELEREFEKENKRYVNFESEEEQEEQQEEMEY